MRDLKFFIESVSPGYVYIGMPLANSQFVSLDAYAKDHKCNQYYITDLLSDEGTPTD